MLTPTETQLNPMIPMVLGLALVTLYVCLFVEFVMWLRPESRQNLKQFKKILTVLLMVFWFSFLVSILIFGWH